MGAGILEICGLFLTVGGACGLVFAASLVSVGLAIALGSAFLMLSGVLLVYVVNVSQARQAPQAVRAAPERSAA